MKKVIALLLVVSLVLMAPAFAMAAQETLRLLGRSEDGYMEENIEFGVSRVGGAVYFHGYNSIYSWAPGDTELTTAYVRYERSEPAADAAEEQAGDPTPEQPEDAAVEPTMEPSEEPDSEQVEDAAVEPTAEPSSEQESDPASESSDMQQSGYPTEVAIGSIFDLNGVPAVIDFDDGKIYEIADKKLVATDYRIDLDSFPGYSGEMYMDRQMVRHVIHEDGRLYMLCMPSDNNWNDLVLNVCDLSTGKTETLTDTQERIVTIAQYTPGKLLMAIEPSYNMRIVDEEDYYVKLRIWDMAKQQYDEGEFIPYKGYNSRGFTYDADTETIYFTQNNRVMSVKWGESASVVNYTVSDNYSDFPAVVIGDAMVITSWDGINIYSVDPTQKPKRILKVSGDYADERTAKFLAEHPDVAIDFVDSSMYSIEQITTTIAAGDAPDLFTYSSYGNIPAMIEKGYAADLTGYPGFIEAFEKLYPQIQEALTFDGKVYGYPYYFDGGLWTYAPSAFEELGLGDFPETMEELMDLVVLWERDYKDDYPEKSLIGYNEDPKSMLFQLILSQYIAMIETPDEPLSFNTPQFRAVMEKLDGLPLTFQTNRDDTVSVTYEYSEPLIETYFYMGNSYDVPRVAVCPPKFSKDSETVAPGYLGAYVVNPQSEEQELAVEYILFMSENMRNEERYAIRPDLNDPIENSYYARDKAESEKSLEEMKNAEVAPENQKDHEAAIAEMERYINEEMERWRWEISEDAIKNYRELAPFIKVQTSSTMYNSDVSQELQKIIERYQQGQLSVDQMIRELDQKAQMIFLETR